MSGVWECYLWLSEVVRAVSGGNFGAFVSSAPRRGRRVFGLFSLVYAVLTWVSNEHPEIKFLSARAQRIDRASVVGFENETFEPEEKSTS